MKIRIKQVDVLQCAKMIAALYFMFSLPVILLFMLLGPLLGQTPASTGAVILFPFVYAFVSYLGGVLRFWIYNVVAQRIGGFEYTAAEVAPQIVGE